MFQMLKTPLRAILRKAGYDLVRVQTALNGDVPESHGLTPAEAADDAIVRAVTPFTMTSRERVLAMIDAVRYVVRHRIPGDIVECGVWRGGSMMAAARTLLEENNRERGLYLFDTFEGMPAPTSHDLDLRGCSAAKQLRETPMGAGVWCYATLDDVRANLATTGYPADRIQFIKGRVEETIPAGAPAKIALLRLDTDWYESTRHELEHLFPRLSAGGVLIIDDYGHWQGARRATDEYFAAHPEIPLLLHRIDYTGRVAISQPPVAGARP